jgi:hypothetical protein
MSPYLGLASDGFIMRLRRVLRPATAGGAQNVFKRQEMEAYVHLGHSRMAGVPTVAEPRR